MRKFIWISLLILFAFGCGSRKRESEKLSSKTEFENKTSGKTSTDFSKTTFTQTDLSELFENQNIKISSNGSPYQVQYKDLIFSGSADIELKNNKKETKLKHKVYDIMVYHRTKIYETFTKYQTTTTFKSVKTERAGISFGNIIWIVIISFCTGAILVPIIKKYIPVWIGKIFK